MADYHPLIARAVAGLDKNTGENRRALYERARKVMPRGVSHDQWHARPFPLYMTRAEGPRAADSRPEKMRWLKVRVTEKAGKRVSINVPLSFARALGEDWPVNLGCRRGATHLTIGDILRSLDSGQDRVRNGLRRRAADRDRRAGGCRRDDERVDVEGRGVDRAEAEPDPQT